MFSLVSTHTDAHMHMQAGKAVAAVSDLSHCTCAQRFLLLCACVLFLFFSVDYAYPLSPLAAFAICLSSIDPKLAV